MDEISVSLTINLGNSSLESNDESSVHTDEIVHRPKYKILEEIGRGGFGRIYKVYNRHNDGVYALKRLCFEGEFQDNKYISAEVYCLSKFKHPNIIVLEEFILKPNRLYIIMEHAEFGNIEQYVTSNHKISVSDIIHFFSQLTSAVHYSHSQNIAHRDITPGNVLLTSKLDTKLADWGLATPCGADRSNPILSDDYLGDYRYQAPEVIRCSPFDPLPTDIWSLGSILYFMLTCNPPFEGSEATILHNQTTIGVTVPDSAANSNNKLEDAIVKTIKFLMVADTNERPVIETVSKRVSSIISQLES